MLSTTSTPSSSSIPCSSSSGLRKTPFNSPYRFLVADPMSPQYFAPFGNLVEPKSSAISISLQAAGLETRKVAAMIPQTRNEELEVEEGLEAYGGERTEKRWGKEQMNLVHGLAHPSFNWLTTLFTKRISPSLTVSGIRLYPRKLPFEIKLLQRNVNSTQMFVPMDKVKRYLVIVCKGDETPDLRTLRAFVVTNQQAITFESGTWFHPIIPIDQPAEFSSFLYEEGESKTQVYTLKKPVTCFISSESKL